MSKTKIQEKLQAYIEEHEMPKTFERGQIVEGEVISATEYQMLVDMGGRAEGIVTGRDLKLYGEKVDKKQGDKVLVYIVNPENEEGQIELSIRKTGDARKWHDLAEAKENNKTIKVSVVEANTGGVIVEMKAGLRGFVPSSQLRNERIYNDTNFKSKEDAKKRLQEKLTRMIDEELEVKIMEIDRNKDRVILSEKLVDSEADLEQRTETLETLNVGDVLTGKVTGVAPFGLFVNAEGLEGLVHLSEISWDKVSNPADFHTIGDEVEVEVIGINDGGKRVAYSIKRLQEDPWKSIVQKYQVGQLVKGTISSIADYGAFVKIEDGLNGLIHISELSSNLVKDTSNVVSVGEEVTVMIISISHEDRHLGLSLKRVKVADDEEVSEEVSESSSEDAREMEGLDKLIEEGQG